ncbi:ABC transporter permease [Mycoplasmopsis anatis]|uniref:Sugar abc transporter permease protein n=1 Tax=Mycoplasmopsis anatis 1340 TaxID=1034808 RepID=F9QED1_9BACT|nr:ABC transporter permease [Mycoplasmopsis anatis]EGS28942.1 sugar abc transporter permease protein [Mycoplasmopsis anatis 1340]VEU73877.1 ABC-type uncharacterized transport system, permease component [Mycoplasmopsis anatis]
MNKTKDNKFINSLNEQFSDKKYKLQKVLTFENGTSTLKKVFSSLWAIVVGMILSGVAYGFYIFISNGSFGNPFEFISSLISSAFNEYNISNFWLYFTIFGFLGLAIAVAFKTGYFNVGVSGQMTLPALLFFSFLILSRNFEPSTITLFVSMILFIVVGFICGLISGLLKSYFNVHEVISTIFLNWIIVSVGKWLLAKENEILIPLSSDNIDTFLSTLPYTTSRLSITTTQIETFKIIGVILLIVLALVFLFIYKNTSIGYKLKMIGLNKHNADYVGVNQKVLTISVLSISGALGGIAGFFLFVIKDKAITGLEAGPIAMGFESIAIALIALNNPIGVLFSSVFYSIIYTAKVPLFSELGVVKEFYPIVTGLMIFIIAIAIVFNKITPIKSLLKWIIILKNKEYWKVRKEYYAEKKNMTNKHNSRVKEVKKLATERKKEFNSETKEYLSQTSKLRKDLNKKDVDINLIYSELARLKFDYNEKVRLAGLDVYQDYISYYKNTKRENKLKFKHYKDELFKDTFRKFINTKIFKKTNLIVEEEK